MKLFQIGLRLPVRGPISHFWTAIVRALDPKARGTSKQWSLMQEKLVLLER